MHEFDKKQLEELGRHSKHNDDRQSKSTGSISFNG